MTTQVLCKGGNVTSAGWQVTLCDPMWRVSSRSGVATLRTAIHLLLTYLLLSLVSPAHEPLLPLAAFKCDDVFCEQIKCDLIWLEGGACVCGAASV